MNEKYLDYIQKKLKDNFDVKWRTIESSSGRVYGIFIDNLCDSKFISEYIIDPILNCKEGIDENTLKNKILYANVIGEVNSEEEALQHILSGDIILISDFFKGVIYCEAKGYPKMSITRPPTDAVIKGPREGFTETFVDNISLIRRKIKNEDLKFKTLVLGKKSNTTVVICYIQGVAPEELVNKIEHKISKLKIDFILDINYIQEELNENNTAFDTFGYSEKPDIVASKLFEGRVAIIVDGTPMVLTLPNFFIENFQAPDDYYFNKSFVNFVRFQRWIAFFVATFLPGIYVAMTTYHFSLIPTIFIFRFANARAGVPFPAVIEVLLMMFFFQLLREAGIRIPQPVGSAISIVGSLILGESAVSAGLASQTTVVVVAVASIATSLTPRLYNATAIWSIVIILFSAILGLPGFYLGLFIIISHIASLTSCGYPYLYPIGTLEKLDYGDVIFRKNLNNISNTLFARKKKHEKN